MINIGRYLGNVGTDIVTKCPERTSGQRYNGSLHRLAASVRRFLAGRTGVPGDQGLREMTPTGLWLRSATRPLYTGQSGIALPVDRHVYKPFKHCILV